MTRLAVTRERILEVADEIGREEGIGRITTRRLCAVLGVTAPALYTHFSAMEEIIDEVVETVVGRIALPGPDAGDWANGFGSASSACTTRCSLTPDWPPAWPSRCLLGVQGRGMPHGSTSYLPPPDSASRMPST